MRLMLGDIADRTQRDAADLAHAFGDLVGGGEDLLGLLIEQQMIVAKMRTAHMPVKVLGLHVQRERIGQQPVEGFGNVAHGAGR